MFAILKLPFIFRSGHLPISSALDLSNYLMEETEYVPWATALGVFSYIEQLMEDKADYKYLQVRDKTI
jgi:hypothetical protein